MQRAEQSTLWITASEDGASATCVGVAPACKELRSGPNKSEREPTSARSTNYGSGHLIPAFHGTGRTFSLLPSHPLDAASCSIDASLGLVLERQSSHDVPHGTSCCGIFATLGEYFCPITLLGDFPVRMSQLEHVGGRAHGCRDDSIDCDSGVRCRFCAGPLGHQAKPLRRCEIEKGTVSDFTSALLLLTGVARGQVPATPDTAFG